MPLQLATTIFPDSMSVTKQYVLNIPCSIIWRLLNNFNCHRLCLWREKDKNFCHCSPVPQRIYSQ
jgi:hypothetical protein